MDRIRKEVLVPLKRMPGYASERAAIESYLADFGDVTGRMRQPMTFSRLSEIRAALDDKIYRSNPLNPSPVLKELRSMRGIVEDELTRSGDEAAKRFGKTFAEEYKAAKLAYRQLSVLDKAGTEALAAKLRNRVVSPSDYMIGAAGLAGGLSHGVGGGLGGIALGAIHHVIRERGNATAAVLLDRASSLSGIQRATRAVDRQLDRGVAGLFGEKAAPMNARAKAVATKPAEEMGAGYKERVAAVTKAAAQSGAHLQAIGAATAAIQPHAPKIANAFERSSLRATMFLASKIPVGEVSANDITPHLHVAQASDADRAKFNRYYDAIHDPAKILHDMARGTATQEQIEALNQLPALKEEIKQRVFAKLTEQKKPVPYATRIQLDRVFGIKLDRSLDPRFIQERQLAFVGAKKSPKAPAPAAPARPLLTAAKHVGLVGESNTAND